MCTKYFNYAFSQFFTTYNLINKVDKAIFLNIHTRTKFTYKYDIFQRHNKFATNITSNYYIQQHNLIKILLVNEIPGLSLKFFSCVLLNILTVVI